MGLDASIPLQIKPVNDPMETMGKAMTLRALSQQGQMQDLQLAEAQRKQQDDLAMADLYRGAFDQTSGKFDHAKVIQGLANAGLGNRIPAYQKQMIETEKAQADLGKTKSETAEIDQNMLKKRVDATNGALASLLSKPDLTHDDVIATLSGLVNQGVISPEEGAAGARGLPGDPVQLRQFLRQKAMQGMEAAKQLEMSLPKVQMVNLGGTEQAVDMNPLTNPKLAGTSFNKTATPDSQLSASVQMRGQNMLDARAREQIQQGKVPAGYRQLPDGSLEAIPGGPHDNNGKPLTEFQGKSTGFAVRAKNSSDIIDKVGKDGDVQPGMIKRMGEAVPFAGEGLGTALNWTQSSQQQQIEQAQRDFINSILRQESGAAIGAGEFENAKKQYFPQPGDSAAVIQQKKANRDLAIRGLETSAGPGIKQFQNASQPANNGLRVGTVQDGYLYTGGDPANASSWKKVK